MLIALAISGGIIISIVWAALTEILETLKIVSPNFATLTLIVDGLSSATVLAILLTCLELYIIG